MEYNIVMANNINIVLASCGTLEITKNFLKDMYKTDLKLKKYYNWTKLPQYKVLEIENDKIKNIYIVESGVIKC